VVDTSERMKKQVNSTNLVILRILEKTMDVSMDVSMDASMDISMDVSMDVNKGFSYIGVVTGGTKYMVDPFFEQGAKHVKLLLQQGHQHSIWGHLVCGTIEHTKLEVGLPSNLFAQDYNK
jgi:hypothetical protein